MTYPDTSLGDDIVDPLYGGEPATAWGALAWQWANNVLRFLSQAHLDYNRQPYRTIVALVATGSLAPGDVAVADLGVSAAQGAYVVRKAIAGDAAALTVYVLGVCVIGAGTGAKARIATSGLLPRTLSGFAALTGGSGVSVNFTTGRLKVAAGVEPVVGLGDVQGNVLLRLGA